MTKSFAFSLMLATAWSSALAQSPAGYVNEDEQLPLKMHSAMKDPPIIRVGQKTGDMIGSDNRTLQSAVEYVAALGGGVVEIGEGTYLMRDSLHLRSHVTVRGRGEKTVLLKAPSVSSRLAVDGDFGEEQVTVEHAEGFHVGDGVALFDNNSGGFHTTVARITGRRGNTFSLDRPLGDDLMVVDKAVAVSVFPVISGYDIEGARVENLTVDGAREANANLNGCRGGGIYLYHGFKTVIENCRVRNYNGDGISFQSSNDVQVVGCLSENNADLGLHPGSGSQRPLIRNCIARNNGSVGLYLCWRVRHGVFEGNQVIDNAGQGVSTGHKDTDNVFRKNVIRGNGANGFIFRGESQRVTADRTAIEDNVIEDNGVKHGGAGIMVFGTTTDVVLRGNIIRDTRAGAQRTQRTGICLQKEVGKVTIEKNEIVADREFEDMRRSNRM